MPQGPRAVRLQNISRAAPYSTLGALVSTSMGTFSTGYAGSTAKNPAYPVEKVPMLVETNAPSMGTFSTGYAGSTAKNPANVTLPFCGMESGVTGQKLTLSCTLNRRTSSL